MNKKRTLLMIFALMIVGGCAIYINNKIQKRATKRYEEIKNDIDKEMQRYIYLIYPTCTKGKTSHITHKELVYNRGMDKEKFLDIDGKSYCKVYVEPKCIEDNKWDWRIYLSCKGYEEKGYKDWDREFSPKP